MRKTFRKFLIGAALLMVMCSTLMAVQAADTLTIGATLPSKLDIDVKTTAFTNWPLDPALPSSQTQTLGQTDGLWVRGNRNGWNVRVTSQKATLTEYSGSDYVTNGNYLISPLTLQVNPTDSGTSSQITVSIPPTSGVSPTLWANGVRMSGVGDGWRKGGLVFNQPVSWDDEPLLESGRSYHNVLTFTVAYP